MEIAPYGLIASAALQRNGGGAGRFSLPRTSEDLCARPSFSLWVDTGVQGITFAPPGKARGLL